MYWTWTVSRQAKTVRGSSKGSAARGKAQHDVLIVIAKAAAENIDAAAMFGIVLHSDAQPYE